MKNVGYPSFSSNVPQPNFESHGSTRSICKNERLATFEIQESIGMNWCLTTNIVDQWDLLIRDDPIKLTAKEKDAQLGHIMKSLPAAPRYDCVSIRENDFNQFCHSFYNWAILLHVNRLDLGTRNNSFLTVSRVRQLKGFDHSKIRV